MIIASHKISIPAILEVSKGNIENIGSLIKKTELSNVVVFFDEGMRKLLGEKVINSLNSKGINILKIYEHDNIEIDDIVHLAFSIPAETDIIIGIGGGKVLDASKYICFLKKLPFISVPTSASNDGFSSSSCSLIIEGRRTSVAAKMPYGIIVDIDVVKNAPEKFIYSGIGDLVSKITSLYDWKFEEQHGKAVADDFAVMIAKKAVNSFVRTEFNSIKDDLFLKELIESLTMNGIAVEIAGNSAPASGSEHLISHALDKLLEKPQLHGIQVGVAAYIMSKVQNHRYQRITKIFEDTGFFKHVKTLGMKVSDFEKAIVVAPSIKPNRYTYIHVEEYREQAKRLLTEDPILREILI